MKRTPRSTWRRSARSSVSRWRSPSELRDRLGDRARLLPGALGDLAPDVLHRLDRPDGRDDVEVVGRWWRLREPLERVPLPRIVARPLAVLDRADDVHD